MPTKLVKPTKAKKEKDHPVRYNETIEPVKAKGMAVKTTKGCEKDLNCNINPYFVYGILTTGGLLQDAANVFIIP